MKPDDRTVLGCVGLSMLAVTVSVLAWKALESLGYFVKWFMGWQ